MLVTFGLTFLVTACKKDNNQKSADTNLHEIHQPLSSQSVISPLDVFKGIFFLQEPFASKIPSYAGALAKYSASDSAEYVRQAFIDEILDSIDLRSATYIPDFKADMETGDYYIMYHSIDDASEMMREIVRNSPNWSFIFQIKDSLEAHINTNNYDVSTQAGLEALLRDAQEKAIDELEDLHALNGVVIPWFVWKVAIWESFVGVNEVAAVTWFLWVYAVKWFWPADGQIYEDPYNIETLCTEISTALDES